MARDQIEDRFEKRLKTKQLSDLAKRARSKDDVEAEEQIVKKAEKVEPIKAQDKPNRNDPCPCGSGKKHKKCCGETA